MKRAFLAILVLLVLILAAASVARLMAPGWIRDHAPAALKEACPECSLELGQVELAALDGILELGDVEYHGPLGSGTRLRVKARRIRVQVGSWLSLRDRPWIREVRIDTPDILIVERDSPPSPKGPSSGLPELRVDKAEVRNGHFTYRAVHPKQDATIEFERVDADTGEWNSFRDGEFPPFDVLMNARGPKTGKIRIQTRFRLAERSREEAHEIDIRITDYDLFQANTFFFPSEGVKLKGVIDESHADVKMFRNDLSGTLRMKYHGLKLDFIAGAGTEARNPITAFLADTIGNMKAEDHQPHDGRPVPVVPVHAKWDGKKGVPGFILGGVGKAAMKLMEK